MQLFTFSHNTSIRTASLYPGIYEPLIMVIKPKPCHIFTEKKFSVRSFFPGDSFVSFFVPPSHWPRAFSREETFQLVGALVHFTNFFLKAGTAPGGGCLPRSVSLAGSAFQPLRPVSPQLSTDSLGPWCWNRTGSSQNQPSSSHTVPDLPCSVSLL